MKEAQPRPIGYVELQRGWVEHKSFDELREIIAEVRNAASMDFPGYVQHGARIEVVKDGAGVDHYTLYMGFAPRAQTTPPLDPSNLNEAPPPPIGWGLPDDVLGVPLGHKERKF